MISIKNTLISEDVLKEEFVCDITACKGACCVEGDGGAPLDNDEIEIIAKNYAAIKPYMNSKGIKAVEEQGNGVIVEGRGETPLVNGKECAYVFFDENNITRCAIELAYRDGKIDFKKPISCELYPVRIESYSEFDAVNYHRWHICKPACECGKKLKVPLFKFLKEPLIKKYGVDWYKSLESYEEKYNI